MGVFKFEEAGTSWDRHERNWFLTRKPEAERKVGAPGYAPTGTSVLLAMGLVLTLVASALKHQGDARDAQRVVSERVASRLGHPQDEEDVLSRLVQVVESSLHSVPGNRPEEIKIELHGTEDGTINSITVNDQPVTEIK